MRLHTTGERRRARPLAITAVVVAGALLIACAPGARAVPASGDDTDYRAVAADARALSVIDPGSAPPKYRRDDFGEAWTDVDGNGCSQRQDVLSRDLVDVEVASDGCTVLTGSLSPDPYTGRAVSFHHDRVAPPGDPGSAGVQIDHIVSLSAAHAGGAWRWNPADRERFANTLDNLLAVDGPTNEAKSNLGPGRWLPPDTGSVCAYVADYTRIAMTWALRVRAEDRDRLVEVADGCAAP